MKTKKSATLGIVADALRERWILYASCALLTIAVALLGGVVTADMLRRITDALTVSDRHALILAVAGFLISALLLVIFTAATSILTHLGSKHITWAMEDCAILHYARLAYWHETPPDQAAATVRNTASAASSEIVAYGYTLLKQGVACAAALIYGLIKAPLVVVVCVAVLIVMVYLSQRKVNLLPALYEKFFAHLNALYGKLWEQVHNHEVAGTLDSHRITSGFDNRLTTFLKDLLHVKKVGNTAEQYASMGSLVIVVLAAAIGGWLHLQNRMQLSDVFAMTVLIPQIGNVLFAIPLHIANFKKHHGTVQAMDIYLNTPVVVEGGKSMELPLTHIKADHVAFVYEQQGGVNGVSLSVKRGEFVCIAGPSGCGKTTLLKLLARILPCQQGEVRYEDVPGTEYDRTMLWKRIGYLSQTPFVIADTLRFNITLGSNDAQLDKRLTAALSDAGLYELIKRMPDGLDTVIDASKLSNGELQKICFAREMFAAHDLLLLDEATASLDPGAEAGILAALQRRAAEGLMVVLVSHRAACLAASQRVVLLDQGTLVDEDTHEALMSRSAFYRKVLQEVSAL